MGTIKDLTVSCSSTFESITIQSAINCNFLLRVRQKKTGHDGQNHFRRSARRPVCISQAADAALSIVRRQPVFIRAEERRGSGTPQARRKAQNKRAQKKGEKEKSPAAACVTRRESKIRCLLIDPFSPREQEEGTKKKDAEEERRRTMKMKKGNTPNQMQRRGQLRRGRVRRSVGAAFASACLIFVSGFHGVESSSCTGSCACAFKDMGFNAEGGG